MNVPVTAIDTLVISGQCTVLAGQGGILRIYDSKAASLLGRIEVFDVQPIHLISHRQSLGDDRVIVAGGRHVAIIAIKHAVDGRFEAAKLLHFTIPAQGWILAVSEHEEGFVLLTTNNNLYEVKTDPRTEGLQDPKLLVNGPGSFLYSGAIKSIDSSRILVAAGSVFGEVLVWVCRRDKHKNDENATSRTLHRFEGHRGSVFGVSISDPILLRGRMVRLVASCSDDRTVQTWEIGDFEDISVEHVANRTHLDTGFGRSIEDTDFRVASGWGHQSRIWDVGDIQLVESGRLSLVTRGEDGTCQLWHSDPISNNKESTTAKLKPVLSDRHHSGKNVWSWALNRDSTGLHILTGGADGRIVYRRVTSDGPQEPMLRRRTVPFRNLPSNLKGKALKEYTVVKDGRVLGLTNDGLVVSTCAQNTDDLSWETVFDDPASPATKLCDNLPNGVFAVGTRSCVYIAIDNLSTSINLLDYFKLPIAWLHAAGHTIDNGKLEICIIVTSMSGESCILWLRDDGNALHSQRSRLQLPDHFIVTSGCYCYKKSLLILGSRAGAVSVYANFISSHTTVEATKCMRHVHGTDAVTSLQFLDTGNRKNQVHVLSTGRDGTYSIHEITPTSTTALVFETVHRSSPPFGPYIEGAHVERGPAGDRLILHGFRSKDFVVWDETSQLDVLSVDCGGAHRSWAFLHGGSENESIFVWTKAGTFNMRRQKNIDHVVLQPGGHGREIKALAVCRRSYSDLSRGLTDAALFATGAEDTTIRLFAVRDDQTGPSQDSQFVQLCVLSEHSAGLQDLIFSPCGKYLFSCGGAEQLFAWQVTLDVPVIGAGVVLLAKMSGTDEDADVRIMGTSILPSECDDATLVVFRVAAAYSNGKTKILRFASSKTTTTGEWQVEHEIAFGAFCLIQVAWLPGATAFQATSSVHALLTAGTNGFINLTSLKTRANESAMAVHRVHQSAVLASDILILSKDTFLVATGGDDNALGLTVVSWSDAKVVPDFATVRVSDAHAAAVTGLKMLSLQTEDDRWAIRLVSAGNDQRVIDWSIKIPRSTSDSTSFGIKRHRCQWTGVADVGCIEMVDSDLLIAGVGMQILRVEDGRADAKQYL